MPAKPHEHGGERKKIEGNKERKTRKEGWSRNNNLLFYLMWEATHEIQMKLWPSGSEEVGGK